MSRRLPEVLRELGHPRVLVIGDLILDRYVEGTVDRISPEAPIQVLHARKETERLGGAAFCAQCAAVFGAKVTLLGAVGDDRAGRRVRALATEAGLTLDVIEAADATTSVKTRYLARNHNTAAQQVLRVDEERVEAFGSDVGAQVVARARALLGDVDVVLVNDYGKGLLTPPVLAELLAAARAAGLPLVVDPHKGTDMSGYRGATALLPNRSESERATGLPLPSVEAAPVVAEALIQQFDLEMALVTLDREGVYLHTRAGGGTHLPTTPREVFDVTGAGDVVLATFGVALASGASPVEAAALANVAAGLEVEHSGVVPITRDQVRTRLAATAQDALSKWVPRVDAAALCERVRAAGRRIVFTNGCFDILHAGHVRYLAAAKAAGDVLIVGLNDDASIARLKGPERPLNPLADRAEVLAGLAAVDHIVAFEEDIPLSLIEALQPDVLVKGADWADKGVVGREFVEARGGTVVLIDLLEGRSTTGLVERIRDVP